MHWPRLSSVTAAPCQTLWISSSRPTGTVMLDQVKENLKRLLAKVPFRTIPP